MNVANVAPGTYGNVITGGSGGSTYSILGSRSDYIWQNATTTKTATSIHIDGDAVFKGNITWQDRDMREWFESVESRLAILRPNLELEAEWTELAELRQRYVELERNLIAKQQVFDILKKSV